MGDHGTKMIVHCEGGTGRTGTFAAAYWVTKGMTAADAILHVRKVRSHAVETLEQEAVLVEFANRIQHRS
jgi:protein-tyrosine phosphatase